MSPHPLDRLDSSGLPKPSSCDDYQHNPCWPPPPVLAPPSPPAYPPTYSIVSHGRGTFVTALVITSAVLALLAFFLSVFIFVRRRRLRREALLEVEAALAAATTSPDNGDGPGGEEVVHHVWHIQTVGLDEAAIESIALTRYRAGVLAASDCTVCLGEFRDGELLRLLPKCAHAFHVQCIDTWLRAHVNCPLCRADVVDPAAAAAAAERHDQPPGADAGVADASAEQSARSTLSMELELPDQQADEQQELRVQIDQPHHASSPERPHRHPGARSHNFRRVASMDSPWPPTASAEEVREDEQAGGQKQGTCGAVRCEVSPGPDQLNRPAMKRSLSASSRWTLLSQHCRARSSLLPL